MKKITRSTAIISVVAFWAGVVVIIGGALQLQAAEPQGRSAQIVDALGPLVRR